MAEFMPQAVLDRMSSAAQVDPAERALVEKLRQRREEGLKDRRRYEPIWHLCQSFMANRQWVGWAPGGRSGRIVELANPSDRERHTENMITQYVWTVMGKLYSDDLMPAIIFRREDVESEEFAKHARAAFRYCWDEELYAEERVQEAFLSQLVYGTSALRCYFDPHKGRVIGQLPIGPDGNPITDMQQAYEFVAAAQEQGQQVEFQEVREGKIVWEPLSPFNLVTPPGVTHERNFPWLMVERPMLTTQIEQLYGKRVKEMDLSAINMVSAQESPSADGATSKTGKLKGHAVHTVCYERPTPQYPKGRELIFSDETLLRVRDELPYELSGDPHDGIVFFKYHKIPDRFWAVGLVEPLIGPQRQRNRARSQLIEMKDRNLGRIYAHKGTITMGNLPKGKIMEVIEVPLGHQFPQETSGTPLGGWIENEIRMNDEAMDRIAGLREVSLGQAPSGISAFSAMALLAEQDDKRLGTVNKSNRLAIAEATKLTLYDIRRYWPPQKQIQMTGPAGMLEQFLFEASQLPEAMLVEVPPGASKPRSQAAEIQKIFDVYHAAIASGRPLPVTWLTNSLEQGKLLPIPEEMEQVQRRAAQVENMMILQTGQVMMPNYYDDDFIHVQVHREQQVEAVSSGKQEIAQALEFHIGLHLEAAQQKQVGQGGPGGGQGGSADPNQQGPRGGERPGTGGPGRASLEGGPAGPPM